MANISKYLLLIVVSIFIIMMVESFGEVTKETANFVNLEIKHYEKHPNNYHYRSLCAIIPPRYPCQRIRRLYSKKK